MNKLLSNLRSKKVRLPETEFHIPELDETVVLRGMTVAEGREWRKLIPKSDQDEEAQEQGTLAAAAYSVIDPATGERYLNNDEGRALLESLSERTIINLIGAFNKLARDSDESAEGNSGPRVAKSGSSTASRSPSAEPSTSSNGASARQP